LNGVVVSSFEFIHLDWNSILFGILLSFIGLLKGCFRFETDLLFVTGVLVAMGVTQSTIK
jgi:hypothetical protein